MKIFLDCLPCLLRQVLEASLMASNDNAVHELIMDEALKLVSNYREYDCAPKICEKMHEIVKRHTNNQDPYATIKANDIAAALKLEGILKNFAFADKEILNNLIKVSATGNVMDSALYSDLDIEACLAEELETPFAIFDEKPFINDISNAEVVLILGDNAGEVVFDKLLVEYLSDKHKVIYAVREKAVINDATKDDALKTGIAKYAELVSTGCSAPGTIIEDCSPKFQQIYKKADVVISKGQGNYEALSDTDRDVYFLLKAKCSRIAKSLGVKINSYVFKKNRT